VETRRLCKLYNTTLSYIRGFRLDATALSVSGVLLLVGFEIARLDRPPHHDGVLYKAEAQARSKAGTKKPELTV
jgi:hypothetical protein